MGIIMLAVGLGALVVIIKSNQDDETAENAEGEANPEDDKKNEVLMFKFREMFEYETAPTVGDGRGESGITPIVATHAQKKSIDIVELLALSEQMKRSVTYLADGTTRVEQGVAWFIHNGRLHFFVLLRPFERVTHELMKRPGEDLFVSFLDAEGQRVVPISAPERIPTHELRVAVTKTRRVPAGWVSYGELPLHGASGDSIHEPKIGWIFSGGLHARLRGLQRAHINREDVVRDPFNLDFQAKSKTNGQ